MFHFNVNDRAKIKMALTIENPVPLDVIATKGTVTKNEYIVAAVSKGIADIFSVFSEDIAKDNPDFFANNMSKEGAYKNFESSWLILEPGEYSIIVDNTGTFTPTRGDTPVNLKLYYLPAE